MSIQKPASSAGFFHVPPFSPAMIRPASPLAPQQVKHRDSAPALHSNPMTIQT